MISLLLNQENENSLERGRHTSADGDGPRWVLGWETLPVIDPPSAPAAVTPPLEGICKGEK
jgi:hypothetical protein